MTESLNHDCYQLNTETIYNDGYFILDIETIEGDNGSIVFMCANHPVTWATKASTWHEFVNSEGRQSFKPVMYGNPAILQLYDLPVRSRVRKPLTAKCRCDILFQQWSTQSELFVAFGMCKLEASTSMKIALIYELISIRYVCVVGYISFWSDTRFRPPCYLSRKQWKYDRYM